MKQENWPFIINLGNSIIGVSVLAMPFCFKQCGIILGSLLLLGSAWLTNVSCNLLIKSAIASKRRSYEFLAFQTFGAAGKLAAEVCIIGLLIGTCIAFYVVIGDLGPLIISKVLQIENNQTLRVSILVILALTVVTPLGLLRSIESLSNISAVSIGFYMVFVVLIFFTSLPHIVEGEWLNSIVLWRTEGIFQSLPIFSMAFGCQTQLFVMYDALQEPSLKQMTMIIKGAISLCTSVYLMVGFFGYVAFHNVEIAGDVLMNLKSTLFTEAIKFGFVLSVAVSFPLCIFPCRASIHTLLFAGEIKSFHDNIGGSTRIPEGRFRLISIGIIFSTFLVGVVVPNVEFVLGMTGATMGSMICYVFPAIMFIRVMSISPNNKTIAQIVLVLGIIILTASTYTTLYSHDKTKPIPAVIDKPDLAIQKKDVKLGVNPADGAKIVDDQKISPVKDPPKQGVNEKRQEPPNPHAPDDTLTNTKDVKGDKKVSPDKGKVKDQSGVSVEKKGGQVGKNDAGVEKEGEKATGDKKQDQVKVESNLKKQNDILNQLAAQQQEQKKLIAEHKQLLQELKDHKKEHDKVGENKPSNGNNDLLKALDINNQQQPAQPKNLQPNPPAGVQQNVDVQKNPNAAGQQKISNQGGQPNAQGGGQVAQQPNIANQPVQNVAQKPVVQNVAQQPNVQNVAQQPVAQNVAQQPVAQNVAQQPVAQNVMKQPVVQNVAQQPVVQNVAQQPVAQNVAKQPVAQNVAQQPVAQNVAKQPVAQNVAQQPNVQNAQNVAQQPVVQQNVQVAAPKPQAGVQPDQAAKAPVQPAGDAKAADIKQGQNVPNPGQNALPGKEAGAQALNNKAADTHVVNKAVKDNLKK